MEQRSKIAKKVTFYGFIVNVALSGAKLIAGILGQSSAMIADAVHSISDFATDIVVIAFVNISGKESDESHKYGHGKFETFATLIISLVLIGVAAGILLNGVKNIMASLRG
ncbi:MAG: cation diffusion facilitator family transporter, partial [Bacteroidia bacterium]|nr:cation diffusion facilitator family transporter [Bacteroidia bacterium]